MLFAHFLKRFVKVGRLTITDATGKTHHFGPGGNGPVSAIRLHDRALHTKLFLNPALCLGEAYMDGTLTVEKGSLGDFLDFCGENLAVMELTPARRLIRRLAMLLRTIVQFNSIRRARRNVAHHYDLADSLYDLFLDGDRQYSCGYFSSPGMTLEQAQQAKKSHLAAKLLLRPGHKVLDIGSGWGGLGLYLAGITDVDVTGVTLSENQHAVSNERAGAMGLSHRARFHLRDYRMVTGRFDRIVSVGMFEHIGLRHYDEFFGKLRELLTDDGVAVLHSIGHYDGPDTPNPWLRKYIFPGGYVPALSQVLPAIERSGLIVTDIEILRMHYAETLKAWRERFMANRDRVLEIPDGNAGRKYDERFCRMWEFYLAASEMTFRHWGNMVFQIQLTRRLGAVPPTRDYIYEFEEAERITAWTDIAAGKRRATRR
jgi:cyclopropane-fatty-acyl-phospholipid synthase